MHDFDFTKDSVDNTNNNYDGQKQEQQNEDYEITTQNNEEQQQQQQQHDINRPLIEVTTSDIVAALMLVAEEQHMNRLLKSTTIYRGGTTTHRAVSSISNGSSSNTSSDRVTSMTNNSHCYEEKKDEEGEEEQCRQQQNRIQVQPITREVAVLLDIEGQQLSVLQQSTVIVDEHHNPSSTTTSSDLMRTDTNSTTIEAAVGDVTDNSTTIEGYMTDVTEEIQFGAETGYVQTLNLGTGSFKASSTSSNDTADDDQHWEQNASTTTSTILDVTNSETKLSGDGRKMGNETDVGYIHTLNLYNGTIIDSSASNDTAVETQQQDDQQSIGSQNIFDDQHGLGMYDIVEGGIASTLHICQGSFVDSTEMSDEENSEQGDESQGHIKVVVDAEPIIEEGCTTNVIDLERKGSFPSVPIDLANDAAGIVLVEQQHESQGTTVQPDQSDTSENKNKYDKMAFTDTVRTGSSDKESVLEHHEQVQMMVQIDSFSQSSQSTSVISGNVTQDQEKVEIGSFCVGEDLEEETRNRKRRPLWVRNHCTQHLTLSDTDAPLLHDLLRYMRISMAVYGSIMYLFNGKRQCCCCPCIHLVSDAMSYQSKKNCCVEKEKLSNSPNNSDDKVNDNVYDTDFTVDGSICCGCDEAAILQMGCDDVTLVYANFKSTVQNCPYSISIDHPRKAVILAVQGTLSLEAAVTDINLSPANILNALILAGHSTSVYYSLYKDAAEAYQFLDGEYCHSGILLCSMNIHRELFQNQKLHRLLLGDTAAFPSYKLLVTGHSLGAGVAAMLSVLLEPIVNERDIEIQCMCFSPPGCTLTKNLANREYITTVVLDSDIVPRLSLDSLENLRNEVLEMIARAKIPKHQILQKGFLRSLYNRSKTDVSKLYDSSTLYCARTDIPNTSFRNDLRKFFAYQQKVKAAREQRVGDTKLMLPGRRIVHLVKDTQFDADPSLEVSYYASMAQPSTSATAQPLYKAVWANPEEDFAEIQLTSSMLSDHLPLSIVTELEILAEYYSHRFTKETTKAPYGVSK